MSKLKVIAFPRNHLTRLGSVGLLAQMVEYKQKLGDTNPIVLNKLDLTGTFLQNDGIAEILPIIATHYSCMNHFIFSACRLTEESTPSIVEFVEK